jgi:hypothetical protein
MKTKFTNFLIKYYFKKRDLKFFKNRNIKAQNVKPCIKSSYKREN